MAGRDPAIHVFSTRQSQIKTWSPESGPGEGEEFYFMPPLAVDSPRKQQIGSDLITAGKRIAKRFAGNLREQVGGRE
jgi:hypothetical protein